MCGKGGRVAQGGEVGAMEKRDTGVRVVRRELRVAGSTRAEVGLWRRGRSGRYGDW